MDLKRKIAWSLAAVGTLATGLSSWTVVEAVQSRSGVEHFRTQVVSVEQSVARLQSDFLGYDDQMNMVTLVVATSPGEKQLIEDTYAQATAARESFTEDLKVARGAAVDPEIRAALDQASASITAYDAFAKTTWADIQAGKILQASKAITVDNAAVSNQLSDALARAAQRADHLATAALSELAGRQVQVLTSGLVLATSIVALLIGMGVFISRSLSKIVDEVMATTDQLANASQQVSGASQSLAQATTEQAAAWRRPSASLDQMAASITQNSENATVTDAMASKAAGHAADGGRAVQQTVERDEGDRGEDRDHRRHRVPDEHARAERDDRGGPGGGARQGLRGRGHRGRQARRAQPGRRAGDRRARRRQRAHRRARGGPAGRDRPEHPAAPRTSCRRSPPTSTEQTTGVAQINRAMTQINQVTQQNASASEELAATAEEMSGQAAGLQQMMRLFTSSRRQARPRLRRRAAPAGPSRRRPGACTVRSSRWRCRVRPGARRRPARRTTRRHFERF